MAEAKDVLPTEEMKELDSTEISDVIKVSSNRSLFFYVDLATKFLSQKDSITLSGLGFAITTVVTIAGVLKNQDVAVVTKVATSQLAVPGSRSPKPRIEVFLEKSSNFNEVYEKKKTLSTENREIREKLEAGRQKIQEQIKKEQAV